MRTETPQPIRLFDYTPPAFLIDHVHLDFDLKPGATRVKARLEIRRNGASGAPLVLNGERLKLKSLVLDGETLSANQYAVDEETLTVPDTPDAFVLETEVEIDPENNKALEGLYMSGGRFCTQCESEGFRKITYYHDRPDVLAKFSVRMEADKAFERLLSNGNLISSGETDDGRRYAEWEDPFPKPAYLFALVGGTLDVLEDTFTTMSGREVELKIYVDPGCAPRAAYAMDALKRSMKWDEERFGREYDLDLFMIVAVRDFNFGAMENKGLNIFNSSLLLANPETATDFDYERIEGVVAHEYFHNWTGNRITCRDWFQLCLKEGLTVFRDQQFSADMRGEAVQRIKEVRQLRARQFAEDAGPLAHPVRPSSFVKIENFYTATVYEKGAELIRMLGIIVGDEAFRAGMDLYFERWDGHATTVEAFIACFAEASGRDLSQFFKWYEQAGTPQLRIETSWDAAAQAVDLTLRQMTAATPGQPEKAPVPIPVSIGILDQDGAEQASQLIVLEEAERTVRLNNVEKPPVLSALRGFSAPVNLTTNAPEKDLYVLLAADTDLFNRWEAGQILARNLILRRADGAPDEVGEERFAEAMGAAIADEGADHAFRALLLGLPTEQDLAMAMSPADPARLHDARNALRTRLAVHLGAELTEIHGALQEAGEFSTDAAAAGRRALRNACIGLLVADPHSGNLERARGHYQAAGNMTDAMGGLGALMQVGGEAFDEALTQFYEKWKDEPLVVDKWFSIQAQSPAEDALARVLALTKHPAFEPTNPNRVRSLVGGLAVANPVRFHDPSGAAYRFLADEILRIDTFNPSFAARFVDSLGGWRRYIPALGNKMREQLQRIIETEGVSKNVLEQASKAAD
jgi:aminopeptidase N